VNTTPQQVRGSIADYVAIARPSHWVKHIFIVPGIVLALLLLEGAPAGLGPSLLFGFLSAAALASANYVLNEWLDASFDAHHPVKSHRPIVAKKLSPALIVCEYGALVGLGLAAASVVSSLFLVTAAGFVTAGLVYNVPPLRLKDRAVLDVVVEAINNPIRLVLGWAMVDGSSLPPGSIILSYWMGGAFLMTIKRLAERRTVIAAGREEALPLYRKSFATYGESFLLIQALTFALLASFFLAVFLVKYRIEYLLLVPVLVALFANYLRLGLRQDSAAEAPERLYREPALLIIVALLIVGFSLLTAYDLPWLEQLTTPHYIRLGS
jgi:4-hydroxybenzoate polyprenyltransferase